MDMVKTGSILLNWRSGPYREYSVEGRNAALNDNFYKYPMTSTGPKCSNY